MLADALLLVALAALAGDCSAVVTASDASAGRTDAAVDTLADAHDGSCRGQYCLSGYECVREDVDGDGGMGFFSVCRSLPSSCGLPSLSDCAQDMFGRCDCPACAARPLCPYSACHVVPVSGPNIRVECGL